MHADMGGEFRSISVFIYITFIDIIEKTVYNRKMIAVIILQIKQKNGFYILTYQE